MKKLPLICAFFLLVSVNAAFSGQTDFSEFNSLSQQQKTDSAMLNYVSYLSYDISAHKDNLLYLEEIYSRIENNILEDKIDLEILSRLSDLRDQIFRFRMIDIQRDRIEYLIQLQISNAIKSVLPSPTSFLNADTILNPISITSSLANSLLTSDTLSSVLKLSQGSDYLLKSCELDDQQLGILHQISQEAFSNRVKYSKEKQISENFLLTSEMLQDFARETNKSNNFSKIAFLEREESRKNYKYFGLYYLALIRSYFEAGRFKDCLDAAADYEAVSVRLFRKDFDYAKVMPFVIAAAQNVYPDSYDKYIEKYFFSNINNGNIEKSADTSDNIDEKLSTDLTIKGNTKETDWALRYFAAQTLIQLYAKTQDSKYLEEAYTICFDAVRKFADEQQNLIEDYKKPIIIPDTATKTEKNILKQRIKEKQTELFPVSEPLVLNCELLVSLVELLDKPNQERSAINSILNDVCVFPQLRAFLVKNPDTESLSSDSFLENLIADTNPKLSEHSSFFKDMFLLEHKGIYSHILMDKFNIQDIEEITRLAELASSSQSKAVWTRDNILSIPAKYLCQTAEISVTINGKEFKDTGYKVKKINKFNSENPSVWTAEISFDSKEIDKYNLIFSGPTVIVAEVSIGNTKTFFVFLSTQTFFGCSIEQVCDQFFQNTTASAVFKFPDAAPKFFGPANVTDNESLPPELLETLHSYMINSVPSLHDKSNLFRTAFAREYGAFFLEKLTKALGCKDKGELLDILYADKDSCNIFAFFDKENLMIPSALCKKAGDKLKIGFVLYEDRQPVLVNTDALVTQSPAQSALANNGRNLPMTNLSIEDPNLNLYPFDQNKEYVLEIQIKTGEQDYNLLFLRQETSFLFFSKSVSYMPVKDYAASKIIF